MLRQSVKRTSSLLTHLKTHRFARQFQSSAENDFFSSSSSSSAAAAATATTATAANFSGPSAEISGIPRRSYSTARIIKSFLKFATVSAITATIGAAGYATYAYTADEVDEKTKAFRSSINRPLEDSTATIENIPRLLYTAVMTTPSRAIDMYLDLRRTIEERVQEVSDPVSDKLLPEMLEGYKGAKTLVLDLRGTLIHSEWKRETGWRTYKRPGLDDFLLRLAQFYEIIIYCDEQMEDPMMSNKFREKGVQYYLTRNHTKYQDGKRYRDLSKLNRDPSNIIYVSAQAFENCLQPENCVAIKPWNKEADDTTLIDLLPFLELIALHSPEVRQTLAVYKGKDIPSEFLERSKRIREMQLKSPSLPWRRNF